MKREQWSEFNKVYVGVVENPGMTYNILEIFNIEVYFSLKVPPLEGNLCLLEEIEEGELFELVESGKDWLIKWFLEIYMWDPMDVDNERLTWLRVHVFLDHMFTQDVLWEKREHSKSIDDVNGEQMGKSMAGPIKSIKRNLRPRKIMSLDVKGNSNQSKCRPSRFPGLPKFNVGGS
ncbi:hypothetical protein KIW84_052730 [Lathyrus oleraceus]|uniref:DUF4283 domain-containing protein n=1 Tax=Pisum sativum TaxID=3888 RepID=A0A9D4WQM8_PEA|nr:hypothetical protein KIW84_052730 [Pisum sativum]